MLWSQRYVVLLAAVSAVLFSAIIAARSSYDGKLRKIAKLFLQYYFANGCSLHYCDASNIFSQLYT